MPNGVECQNNAEITLLIALVYHCQMIFIRNPYRLPRKYRHPRHHRNGHHRSPPQITWMWVLFLNILQIIE